MSKTPKPTRVGEAWCSQHDMHPSQCFNRHYLASDGEKTPTEAEHRQTIINEHIRKQNENIRKQRERLNRDPEKLREQHKDIRRKIG